MSSESRKREESAEKTAVEAPEPAEKTLEDPEEAEIQSILAGLAPKPVPTWQRENTPHAAGADWATYAHSARPLPKQRDTLPFPIMRSVELNVTPTPGLEVPSSDPGPPDPDPPSDAEPEAPEHAALLEEKTDPGLGPPSSEVPAAEKTPEPSAAEVETESVLINREARATFRNMVARLEDTAPITPRPRRGLAAMGLAFLGGALVIGLGAILFLRMGGATNNEQPAPTVLASSLFMAAVPRPSTSASAPVAASTVAPSANTAPPPALPARPTAPTVARPAVPPRTPATMASPAPRPSATTPPSSATSRFSGFEAPELQ